MPYTVGRGPRVRGRAMRRAALASLGDVVTSTDPANNAVSGDPVAVQVWREHVVKKGGNAVRLKADKSAAGNSRGVLYERYPDLSKVPPYRYVVAPLFVRLADERRAGADITRVQAVKLLEGAQGAARAVLNAPRDVVAAVTGIPKNLVTILLVGGLAVALASKARGLFR